MTLGSLNGAQAGHDDVGRSEILSGDQVAVSWSSDQYAFARVQEINRLEKLILGLEASTTDSRSDADNSPGTASDLGGIQGLVTVEDWVGREDAADWYQFRVEAPVNRVLIGLSTNFVTSFQQVKVGIYQPSTDAAPTILLEDVALTSGRSLAPLWLPAGTYLLGVMPAPSGGDSDYRLDIRSEVRDSPGGGDNESGSSVSLGATGGVLEANDWVGSLDPEDWYRFEVDPGVRKVSLVLTNGLRGLDLEWYRNIAGAASPELLWTNRSRSSGTVSHTLWLDPGSYLVRIRSVDRASSEYALRVASVATSSAGLGDNTARSATDLGVLRHVHSVEDWVGVSDDLDLIRFQVAETPRDFELIVTTEETERVAVDLGLLRVSDGAIELKETAETAQGRLSFPRKLLLPGTYYLRIRSRGAAPYRLRIISYPNGVEPLVAGRPLSLIVARGNSNSVSGTIRSINGGQFMSDGVVFSEGGSSGSSTGIYRVRDGRFSRVARIDNPVGGTSLDRLGNALSAELQAGDPLVFTGSAGNGLEGLYLARSNQITALWTPGDVLPNTPRTTVRQFGDLLWANDTAVVVGTLSDLPGNGIYRITTTGVEAVVDARTRLPDSAGSSFDIDRTRIGFDGRTVAFSTIRRLASAEGLFVQNEDRSFAKVFESGVTALSGGRLIRRLLGSPLVIEGKTFCLVEDELGGSHLVQYDGSSLSVLQEDIGMDGPYGALSQIGSGGFLHSEGTFYFSASTEFGPGIFSIFDGRLKTIIPPGAALASSMPARLNLWDLVGDTLLIETGGRLMANVADPVQPVFLSRPLPQTVSGGARVEMSVSVFGAGPFTYRWYHDDTEIPAATNRTLVLFEAWAEDVGNYSVSVSNDRGRIRSRDAFLNVLVPPVIIAQPTNVSVAIEETFRLEVRAIGGQPLSYHWLRDGLPVKNESTEPGVFLRRIRRVEEGGRYQAVVRNASGETPSDAVMVTVIPPDPNPRVAGHELVSVMDNSQDLAPSEKEGLFSARWLGDSVVMSGSIRGPRTNLNPGVLRWENGRLSVVLTDGISLPNDLGSARGFILVRPASSSAALTFYAFSRGGLGLYGYADDSLQVIADRSTTLPDLGGILFQSEGFHAVQDEDRTLFLYEGALGTGLYLSESNHLREVIGPTTVITDTGERVGRLGSFDLLGDQVAGSVTIDGTSRELALRLGLQGGMERLMASGDSVPGSTETVFQFSSVRMSGEVIFIDLTTMSGFRRHLLAWTNGVVTRCVGPRDASSGTESFTWDESDRWATYGGRAYLGGWVQRGQTNVPAIVTVGPSGMSEVLVANKLDGLSVISLHPMDVTGDRILVVANFRDGSSGLYATVVDEAPQPLVLRGEVTSASHLRLHWDRPAKLESAGSVKGPWHPLHDGESVEVELDQEARFFRLIPPSGD